MRAEMLLALSQEPRVQEVKELEFNLDRRARKLYIDFVITMESGNDVEGQEVLELE